MVLKKYMCVLVVFFFSMSDGFTGTNNFKDTLKGRIFHKTNLTFETFKDAINNQNPSAQKKIRNYLKATGLSPIERSIEIQKTKISHDCDQKRLLKEQCDSQLLKLYQEKKTHQEIFSLKKSVLAYDILALKVFYAQIFTEILSGDFNWLKINCPSGNNPISQKCQDKVESLNSLEHQIIQLINESSSRENNEKQ